MVLVALDISPQGQCNHLGQPFANPGYLRLLTARVFGPSDGIYRPLFLSLGFAAKLSRRQRFPVYLLPPRTHSPRPQLPTTDEPPQTRHRPEPVGHLRVHAWRRTFCGSGQRRRGSHPMLENFHCPKCPLLSVCRSPLPRRSPIF